MQHCPHSAIPLSPSHSGSSAHPAPPPFPHAHSAPPHLLQGQHAHHAHGQSHLNPHPDHAHARDMHQPAMPHTGMTHALDEPHPHMPDAVVAAPLPATVAGTVTSTGTRATADESLTDVSVTTSQTDPITGAVVHFPRMPWRSGAEQAWCERPLREETIWWS